MKLTSSNAFSRQDLILKGYRTFSRQDLILKGYSHLKLLDCGRKFHGKSWHVYCMRERKDYGVTKESGQDRCWSS